MSRERKIDLLLQRLYDDSRRMDLDQIDDDARSTHTWGSSEHRLARGKRELTYDAARAAYEKLSDEELDQALASSDSSD